MPNVEITVEQQAAIKAECLRILRKTQYSHDRAYKVTCDEIRDIILESGLELPEVDGFRRLPDDVRWIVGLLKLKEVQG